MSTTAFRRDHPPVSFPRRNIGTSTTTTIAMTNDHSRSSAQKNSPLEPIPPIRESLSTNPINNKSSPATPLPYSLSSESPITNTHGRSYSNTNEKSSASPKTKTRDRSNINTNEKSTIKSSNHTYTFSNKPRELPQNPKHLHHNRLRQRVLSAPDENSFQSPPSFKLNKQKPSSADGSLTPRSSDDNKLIRSTHHLLKRDEQQEHSSNVLMKEQKRSKVPQAVQKRRILLLFHDSPPRQDNNPSPIHDNHQIQQQTSTIRTDNTGNISSKNLNSLKISKALLTDSLNNAEPEVADSMQLAVILANIQLQEDSNSNNTSPQHQQTPLDLGRYDYVVSNPLDTATFRLSPRTLGLHEEIAARTRFSQHYRQEIQSSANARIPSLMASVITENNNTIGNNIANGQTITFTVNPVDTIRQESSFDGVESDASAMDNEQIQLCYDATLNCFYDPKTGIYYDLSPA